MSLRSAQRGTMIGGLAAMLLVAVVAGALAIGAHLLGWHLVGRLAECSPFLGVGVWLLWRLFDWRLPGQSWRDRLIMFGVAVPLTAPGVIFAVEPELLPVHPNVISFVALLLLLALLYRVSARSVDAKLRLALVNAASSGIGPPVKMRCA